MYIYVECYNDKFLFKQIINQLTSRTVTINHAGDKVRVIRKVEKNRTGIGVVDKDHETLTKRLNQAKLLTTNENLSVYKFHKALFIEIDPDLEGWLYWVAQQNGVKANKFNLPNSVNGYPSGHIKNMYKKAGFANFLDALKGTPQFQFLVNQISKHLP